MNYCRLARNTLVIAGSLVLTACASVGTESRPDFSGLWQVTDYDEVIRPEEHAEYTQEALDQMAFYKEHFDTVEESHAKFCGTTGTPWSVLGRARDYPTEIVQGDDHIVLWLEYMDQVRHIRIGETFPDYIPPSLQGYSVAHWEGDELVIETKGFTGTSEATIFHRSEDARVVERWRLDQHPEYGEVLEINLVMYDPVYYKEPVKGRNLLRHADEGVVMGSYNCAATLWEDFVEKRKEEIGYYD